VTELRCRTLGTVLTREELRAALALRFELFRDGSEGDGPDSTFNAGRGLDAEAYGDTIVERASRVGALRAACEDIADAIGAVDYDEAVWAVQAVVQQWHRVADEIGVGDPLALRVRTVAEELSWTMLHGEFEHEMLPDIVSISALDAELTDHAVVWHESVEGGAEDDFWNAHEAEVRASFVLSAGLRADLRARGELGLDDKLLPPPEG
jgi:hypothetical protein